MKLISQLYRSTTLLFLLLAAFTLACFSSPNIANTQPQSPPTAHLLEIKGAIGPAIADYVIRSIAKAERAQANVVVMEMDTPGGLSESMREINQAILASKVPIVTYVSPSGARAASAGTYILYASHFAAMTPGTNLGAATPVSIGLTGSPEAKTENENGASALENKATSDATAYIRSLAQLRGRNVEWAIQAVLKAESLSDKEALTKNVIDFRAENINTLLSDLNGRTTQIDGQPMTLYTDNIIIKKIKPDWRSRFLSVITDPSIAYLLLLVGIYGLFLEFTSPGVILPGVLGGISLLIGLYALQMLPINYVGLALIFLGIIFLISEVFISSYGILSIGGVIAFLMGSVMLIDTNEIGFGIPIYLIVFVTLFTASFVVLILRMAIRSQHTPDVTGREALLISTGEIVSALDNHYRVRIQGELWQAVSTVPLQVGQTVKVTDMQGLILQVEPLNLTQGN